MLDRKELILEGLAYTVMGMIVVFAILIIIMLVIKAMALFSSDDSDKGNKEELVKTVDAPIPAEKNDDNTVVAIITAAIAAMLGKSATGFRIRSYRKIQDGEWNKAGRREVLDNKI